MIGRKTSLAMANMFVGVVLGLVAQKLIAIYFGEGPFGQVMFALSFIGIVFFVTDLGMGQAHVKRVSEGRHAGDCFATFAVFKIASTALFVILILGLLWLYMGVLGKPLITTTLPVILLVLAYYVAKSIQEIGQSSFEARLETARLQMTSLSDTLVRVGLTVLGAFAVGAVIHGSGPLADRIAPGSALAEWLRANPATVLAIAITMGGIAAATVAIVMFLRIRERGRFRWPIFKDYASFALPLFLTSAVSAISAHIDGAAIGLFLSDEETGIFAGVRRIVFVLAGIAPPLGALLFPMFSGLSARGDGAAISRHMDQAIRYLSMFVLPAVAFTVAFPEAIIRLTLADTFLPGAATMAVLALYVYVMTIAAPHANLLMGIGKPRTVARIGVTTAVVVIVLDVLLVPNDIRSLGIRLPGLGILGAALGTLASGVIYYGLVRAATRSAIGYKERAHLWKHALAAVVMVGALLAVSAWAFELVHWYHFIAYMLVGGVVYFAALVALREFTRDDWRLLVESVHPIEMLRYVRDELRHKNNDAEEQGKNV